MEAVRGERGGAGKGGGDHHHRQPVGWGRFAWEEPMPRRIEEDLRVDPLKIVHDAHPDLRWGSDPSRFARWYGEHDRG